MSSLDTKPSDTRLLETEPLDKKRGSEQAACRKGVPQPSLKLLKGIRWVVICALFHALLAVWGDHYAVVFLRQTLLMGWGLLGIALGIVVLWDLLWIRIWSVNIHVKRELPSRFAVGEWNTVELAIEHDGRKAIEIYLADFFPTTAEVKYLPATVELFPGQVSHIRYKIRPSVRGELELTGFQVLFYSRLKFWVDQLWIDQKDVVKVYPNFMALHHHELTLAEQRVMVNGPRKVRPRGQGMEFHQLRHYQSGDSLRQVDWKATSRHRRLISKDYQAESDQSLIFLLDCGRRMRVRDGDLSHFDHAMKSLLLLAYVALKQGDSVGLLTFGHDERWIPPGKSQSQINRLLNTLYDQQTAPVASDYLAMAKRVLAKQTRRSLVVLLTNVRDENLGELVPAMRHLQQRHRLLIANLREQSLVDVLKQPVENFDDAIRYAGTVHYFHQCRSVNERFLHDNVTAIESTPQELPGRLVSQYQMIRGNG